MTSPPEPPSWTTLFADVPLETARARRRTRRLVLLAVAGVVVVAAVVGGLVAWWPPRTNTADGPAARTSSAPATSSAPEARLTRFLPQGYPPDACAPGPAGRALAALTCGANVDAGGPPSATYSLLDGQESLDAALGDVMRSSSRVDCPGGIKSPGPWRAAQPTGASPSGTLFCGYQSDKPVIAWTTDARRTLSVARAGEGGPAIDVLYRWWSVHS